MLYTSTLLIVVSSLTTNLLVEAFSIFATHHNTHVSASVFQTKGSCTLLFETSAPIHHHGSKVTSSPRNDTATLWSYVYSLKKTQLILNDEKEPKPTVSRSVKNTALRPVRSLYFFLKENQLCRCPSTDNSNDSIAEPLQRAVTQAMRLAGSVNDYQLILQLVDSVQTYAAKSEAVLDPRILGEAVTALGKTSANVNKIRTLWRTTDTSKSTWSREIGPMEVNAMLQVLRERGKTRALLNLYHETSESTDAYSLSIVLLALKESLPVSNGKSNTLQPVKNETIPLQHRFLQGLLEDNVLSWQWTEAIKALDASFAVLNNPVASALLQLNAAATRSASPHNGPHMALQIHHILTTHTFMELDAVTCTMILQNLGSYHRAALTIFHAYGDSPTDSMVGAASAVCIRGRQYDTAMDLISSHVLKDATAPRVYHGLLQALVAPRSRKRTSKTRKDALQRVKAALGILSLLLPIIENNKDDMLHTCRVFLAVLASSGRHLKPVDWESLIDDSSGSNSVLSEYFRLSNATSLTSEALVRSVLRFLSDRQVDSCPSTLRHAIGAIGASSIVPFLREQSTSNISAEMYKTALRVLADEHGKAGATLQVVEMMNADQWDSECLLHVVHAIGRTKEMAPCLPDLLLDNNEAVALLATYDINVTHIFNERWLDERHYTSAVCSNLLEFNYAGAQKLLLRMHEETVSTTENMQAIAFAFATAALSLSSRQTPRSITHKVGKSRALSAYRIQKNLHDPSIPLLIILTRACCFSGLESESKELLGKLHGKIVALNAESGSVPLKENEQSWALASLHRDLLRRYAREGDLVSALETCESIDRLSSELAATNSLAYGTAEVSAATILTVGAVELKYLVAAATSAQHWKVCLQTFQRMKPYVEATRQATSGEHQQSLDKEYGKLEPALIDMTKCLANTRQYAWILRVVNDWIEWSGRRPPATAMQNAVRLLSRKGRAAEVCAIVLRCSTMESSRTKGDDHLYCPVVFSTAITSLYKHGFYDAADDMFLAAVSQGAIPFKRIREEEGSQRTITLDLHGLNLALAHSAVRITLQQEALVEASNADDEVKFTIITGRGLNSVLQLRPVLRPEVQRMLIEEFFPPLGTSTVPWNTGALQINPIDASAWVEHQKQQKGTRMLIVAAMLKKATRPLQVVLSQAVESGYSESAPKD